MRSDAYQISSSKMYAECVSLYACCCFLMNAHIIEKKRSQQWHANVERRRAKPNSLCKSKLWIHLWSRDVFFPRRLEKQKNAKTRGIVFHQRRPQKKREINNYECDVRAKWVFVRRRAGSHFRKKISSREWNMKCISMEMHPEAMRY